MYQKQEKRRTKSKPEPRVVYKMVGTNEENQEYVDRAFDTLFEAVFKRLRSVDNAG